MRNSAYSALFETWATRHELIRHRPDSPRFARIIVSADPYQRQMDLLEMQQVLLGELLQPGAGEQVLVLESLQTQFRDNNGDNYQRQSRGAFFVLQQKTADLQPWELLDRTEQTGEEILAAVRHQYENQVKVRWPVGSIISDSIGPVGSDGTWHGTRFDFEIFSPANAGLTYNPTKFSS